jgi:hypothetical protein
MIKEKGATQYEFGEKSIYLWIERRRECKGAKGTTVKGIWVD